jgi:hypothetical protein
MESRSQTLLAHTYNPSNLGNWDLEDWDSKPAWANIPSPK